ncbi:MAG: DUF4143 domain-containing protein [Acholeplasmatales bacterium]|jgi:predicted AAA+ superfamily ATPase|nr:DUF4143 domain-containing protein [Acholeplasmatales bacterium]
MLKRKIYNQLLIWKDNINKKPLLLQGSGQTGKSYIVNYFGENEYKGRFISINFLLQPNLKSLFDSDITGEAIVTNLKTLYKDNFTDNLKVLLFLDEIEECPNAIIALKKLSSISTIDVIVSGTLLGIYFKNVSLLPTKYVDYLTLYPLDFEEFLWSAGFDENIGSILNDLFISKKQVNETMHLFYMNYFKQYLIVGGMPEVVTIYQRTKDFSMVLIYQKKILSDYKDYIFKHCTKGDKLKARECFDSIPYQLDKDNHKFQYKIVSKQARSASYEGSINWLIEAGMICKCNNLSSISMPLQQYKEKDSFRIYLIDHGLYIAMLGEETQKIIYFDSEGVSKGGVYENFMANTLLRNDKQLFYYEKDSKVEVDFVTNSKDEIAVIDVKAGNQNSASLKYLINNNSTSLACKVSNNNLGVWDKYITIPYYLAMFIK